nr:hypothetical protein [Arthrobacter sp. Soil762]
MRPIPSIDAAKPYRRETSTDGVVLVGKVHFTNRRSYADQGVAGSGQLHRLGAPKPRRGADVTELAVSLEEGHTDVSVAVNDVPR